VYQESGSKIYLPRFFGLQEFGGPDVSLIPEGDDINVPFTGDLRDYQVHIVDTYMRAARKEGGGGGLLEIPCGRGKTVIALNIMSLLKKKTLIIVHKSFLMSQWISRMEQFIPSARIGKIQGQVIDIEGKDVVIGMLQSLSMKEYPQNMFSSFGLTVVDECHHISSEVFSRSLLKIVTKYTLGLSATMQRKDGLTKVFKMFLGDIVYSEKRESDDSVMVKGIKYEVNDAEFNETVYDYRGNPQYSTMLSKVCTYSHRTEFILEIIRKELEIFPNQQILVLGHYRNQLGYIHDAIAARSIASVGYYVGGMKQADLDASEGKQIIVATFGMAAEALDIKSLTTLLLATPKTDVVQSVGRILRVKHERPLVIDVIDSHKVFHDQWLKRLSYYKKNKYNVKTTNISGYRKDEWVVEDSSTKKSKKPTVDSETGLRKGICAISFS
jgi:superfamily II DNA or RNA helicase